MACCMVPAKLVLLFSMPTEAQRSYASTMRVSMRRPLRPSASVQQLVSTSNRATFSEMINLEEDAAEIMCDPCGDKGWIVCDFCNGQKINVKSPSNRIYRRCPTCKAVGCILCANCKVFKCVTFPNFDDALDSNL